MVDHHLLLSYVSGTTQVKEVEALLLDRDSIIKEIQFQLQRAHNRMKQNAVRKRRELVFKEGD